VREVGTAQNSAQEPARPIYAQESGLAQQAQAILYDWNTRLDFWTQGSIKALYRTTLVYYRLLDCSHRRFPKAIDLAGSKSLEL
jgi:hypothetical protein